MDTQTTNPENQLTIHLCGVFRIVNASGEDVTPRGMKTCGLLALLAVSHLYKRTRIWVQDKLWSDRGKVQGAQSLRQALSEIRLQLGPHKDALLATRLHLALDPAKITVIDDPQHGSFLEGIDIADEEFEEWLTLERSKRAVLNRLLSPSISKVTLEPNNPLSVHFVTAQHDDEALTAVEEFLLDSLACTLRENLVADIKYLPRGDAAPAEQAPCHVRVKARAFSMGPQVIGLRVSAEDGTSGTLIWSDTQQTFLRGILPVDSVALLRIGNQMVDALGSYFARKVDDPNQATAGMLLHLALTHLFSMSREGSIEADRLLQKAMSVAPRNGLLAATRAHVRSIQWVERYGLNEDMLRDEAKLYAEQALQFEPTNSAVLATIANTSLILNRDFHLSEELSNRAISYNPGNPFAWWVRSASELYLENYDSAYKSAKRASALLGPGPFKFWWDQQRGLTTAIAGSLHEAILALRKTHAVAPTFRPALRVLIALYALSDDEENTAEMINRLKRIEKDFSVDRFLKDSAYPAKLLRKEPFLNTRSKSLLKGL